MEDWLSLSNAEVQAILVEAARPRTREMCARELRKLISMIDTAAVSDENLLT